MPCPSNSLGATLAIQHSAKGESRVNRLRACNPPVQASTRGSSKRIYASSAARACGTHRNGHERIGPSLGVRKDETLWTHAQCASNQG